MPYVDGPCGGTGNASAENTGAVCDEDFGWVLVNVFDNRSLLKFGYDLGWAAKSFIV